MNRWLLIDSGAGDYAFNMALDEALLEFASRLGQPVLRFYGWTQPAASFGYFQHIADIERATHLRPLIRRPTGGGLVPHDADWTYSVTVPVQRAWYELRAGESYEQMHHWIQSAFALLDAITELAVSCRKEVPGQCFAGYEKSDLLWFGKKIAGAAQRRTKSGLLIQGSIQPQPPGVARHQWQTAMCEAAGTEFGAQWERTSPPSEIEAAAHNLVAAKYSRNEYNRRR